MSYEEKKTQFIVYLIFENQLNTNKMMKCIMIVTCFYVVYVNWSYPSQTNLVMWIVCSFCFSSLFFLFSFFCVLFSSFPAKKKSKNSHYILTQKIANQTIWRMHRRCYLFQFIDFHLWTCNW